MGLDGALSIARASLLNINAQMGVVSNNVANAGTPDYTREVANQSNLVAGGQSLGVHTDATTRAIDTALQRSVFEQDTVVAGLTTTTTSLRDIDAVQGTPGLGNDLGGLLGKVQAAFSTLLGDPSSAPQQSSVLAASANLAGGINRLSVAYMRQRQAAQDDVATSVSSLNQQLGQIGSLSNKIVAARTAGQSTADLENQRDAVVHAMSGLLEVRTLVQPGGELVVFTASGVQLPTRATTGPLTTGAATIGAGSSYASGNIPAITLDGIDITGQLRGGRLGADIALRDTTLPTFQGELDEFAFSLAARFDAQGLTLFTDPTGNAPVGGGAPEQAGYVGFAAQIQVNPAVSAAPFLVRDGTHDVAGSPVGASAFTVNPALGPAGFATLINRVLNFALGSQAQSGVPQPAHATAGLGPDGTLNAPYAAQATLAAQATALVAAQAGVSAAASNQLSVEEAVQTTLTSRLTAATGVNMDNEMAHMIQLQSAYGASARIIAAVQSLFNELLQAVR